MDKEIKGYKDDSNEEKNTETNEKNDLIDKDIEKESETSNGDNNEIDKENQILNISIDKPIEFNKSKLENIEFESDEDLIEKEDIDINEDRIDKNKIKNKNAVGLKKLDSATDVINKYTIVINIAKPASLFIFNFLIDINKK